MYRTTDLQDGLENAIEYRQNTNPRFEKLEADLVTSVTGLKINHPLITVENVYHTLEEADADYYLPWVNITTYSKDDIVKVITGANVTLYISLIDGNTSNDPLTSPTEWAVYKPVTEYLRYTRKESVNKVVEDVLRMQKLHERIKNAFEKVTIHRSAGRLTDKAIRQNRFVGYEIEMLYQDELTTIINRIGLQFDTQQSFNIYVFHTSRHEPIATIPVTLDNSTFFQWVSPEEELVLRYSSEDYETGGKFYIGYKESEVSGQAIIKKDINVHNGFGYCRSCNPSQFSDWQKWSKYLGIRTFQVDEDEFINDGLWDIEKTTYVGNTNWGLNLEMSVECDLTDYLLRKHHMLSNPIKLQTEVQILEGFKNNTRTSEVSKRVRNLAINSLQDKDNMNRITDEYKKSIKALDFDLTELGSVCFPCSGPRNIRTRTV